MNEKKKKQYTRSTIQNVGNTNRSDKQTDTIFKTNRFIYTSLGWKLEIVNKFKRCKKMYLLCNSVMQLFFFSIVVETFFLDHKKNIFVQDNNVIN